MNANHHCNSVDVVPGCLQPSATYFVPYVSTGTILLFLCLNTAICTLNKYYFATVFFTFITALLSLDISTYRCKYIHFFKSSFQSHEIIMCVTDWNNIDLYRSVLITSRLEKCYYSACSFLSLCKLKNFPSPCGNSKKKQWVAPRVKNLRDWSRPFFRETRPEFLHIRITRTTR